MFYSGYILKAEQVGFAHGLGVWVVKVSFLVSAS